MYPKFIEVHRANNGKPVSINVSAITHFFWYVDKENEETNIELNTNQYVNAKETYDEIKALIKDCGCLICKADPRLDTEHPLTMDDLRTMVGEPVWNSNSRKWGLVKEVREDDVTLVYQAADWVIVGPEGLNKYPLYRMKKEVAGSKRKDEDDDTTG